MAASGPRSPDLWRMVRLVLGVVLATLFTVSCASDRPIPDPLATRREQFRQEARAGIEGPGLLEYRRWLEGLSGDYPFAGTLTFHMVPWERGELGTIVLMPPTDQDLRGIMVAWHGFLSYSAYNVPALMRLAEDGWVVLAADLPGHGFSTGVGEPFGTFDAYAQASDAMARYGDRLWATLTSKSPVRILLGHSAGGGAAVEALSRGGIDWDGGIFLAPLVYPRYWGAIGFAVALADPFVDYLPPRGYEEGFLGAPGIPLSWVHSLARWQRSLSWIPAESCPPILVVWGGKETSLNIDRTTRTLERLWPGLDRADLPEAGHIIFDLGVQQDLALSIIHAFLNQHWPEP